MNWKTYTPLAVAVTMGLLAARVGLSLVNSGGPRLVEGPAMVPVLVAARDVEPGTTLVDTDLTTAKVPAETLPANAFTSAGQSAGRVTKIALVRGQTMTPNLLADDGAGYGVGATLPEGMRAITVDINDTTGVAGFILPKCHVDVITTLSDANSAKSLARTLLSDVLVIAVGSRTNPTAATDPQAPPTKTATLLVNPKQAETLELATTMSRVRLVLRNGRDRTAVESDGITVAQLKGQETDPFGDRATLAAGPATRPAGSEFVPVSNPLAPATDSWTVQIIKAGQVTSQKFDVPATQPAAVEANDTVVHINAENNEEF